MNSELTLLSEEQIWGSNRLKVIKKRGTQVAITDLAILTGGYVSDYHVEEDNTLSGRTGWIWTSSDDKAGDVRAVCIDGSKRNDYRYNRDLCVRPTLQSSAILNTISPNIVKGYHGVEEVEFGEYPQMAADGQMQQILEREYGKGTLQKTGKDYTFDSRRHDDYDDGFSPVIYDEYEYQGKKYIRIEANTCYSEQVKLSNGLEVRNGDYVWVEVQPIRWLFDRKARMLVSKKGLVSGIRYHGDKIIYQGDFKKTEMYTYMNTYMVKDMCTSVPIEMKKEEAVEEDEVSKLISKIKRLIEPMEDSKEQEILARIDRLIATYQENIKALEPDISFDNTLTLETESSFEMLRINLIIQLENIIRSLSENELLLNLLDQVHSYEELIQQNVEMPSRVENVTDKILYIIAVAKICNCPKILEELRKSFNDIDSKISKLLSNLYTDDCQLTLENEEHIQKTFSKVIQNIYEATNKYYAIQLLLRGLGETELAKDMHTLLFLLDSSNLTNKTEMLLKLDALKKKMDLDVCLKHDFKDIILMIRSEMQPIIEELSFYNGTVSEVQREILSLLQDENMPINIKEKSKLEFAKLLEEWKERLENKEKANMNHPLYSNLPNNIALQLLFLSDLYFIKYKIELYLKSKQQFDRDSKRV